MAPWSKFHSHPSGAGMMGRPADLARLLRRMLEMGDAVWRGRFDDQLALKRLHREEYPSVKVDSLSRVMTRGDKFMNRL